jgi:hypothetical protein
LNVAGTILLSMSLESFISGLVTIEKIFHL